MLDAANPDLPDTKPLSSKQVDDQVAGRPYLPSLLGLPDDGRVRIVDTAVGRVVQTVAPKPNQRVAVTGGRVLTVTGDARDGTCYYGVVATDPPDGGAVWRRDGLNLRTAGNGSACKQDRDPAGGDDVVLGVDPVGREQLLAAHDGRVLWRGREEPGRDGGRRPVRGDPQRRRPDVQRPVVRQRRHRVAAVGQRRGVGGAQPVRGDRGRTPRRGGSSRCRRPVAGCWSRRVPKPRFSRPGRAA